VGETDWMNKKESFVSQMTSSGVRVDKI